MLFMKKYGAKYNNINNGKVAYNFLSKDIKISSN